MKTWTRLLLVAGVLGVLGYAYWKLAIPIHRLDIDSELIMLGDLDGDHQWAAGDVQALAAFVRDPFAAPDALVFLIDMNQNGLIDEEDRSILRALVAAGGNPYAAEDNSRTRNEPFPRPRELYRYASVAEYRPRPLWALPYPLSENSPLDWLPALQPPVSIGSYSEALDAAIYAEAVRFDQSWRKREPGLLPIEREYAVRKLEHVKTLFDGGDRFELLLALMELVEDGETLTAKDQSDFPLKLLAFRDRLRALLRSQPYADFEAGRQDWRAVLRLVARDFETDFGMAVDFETLAPPRNLTHLENYLLRAEWQYHKSTTREEDFRALIGYAQHDPRYLRAVSRTSRRLTDITLDNHNLPMVLLFREALRIKGGDKKKAVGLLDEALRVPYAWIKTIPREALPPSVAFDNFLIPGNMEDGADKSRHWNVFGGICIYKSPQEALDLALKREMQDLRDDAYSKDAMREFVRDMIGNLNGMYHVMTVKPRPESDLGEGRR